MANNEDENVHGARRFMRRVIHSGIEDVNLVYPKSIPAVERIFSPQYHVSIERQKVVMHPSPHPQRRAQLLEAAKTVSQAMRKNMRTRAKTSPIKRSRTPMPTAARRLSLSQLAKRVARLEKSKEQLTEQLRTIKAQTKQQTQPLEHLVETSQKNTEEISQIKLTVNKNFRKASQIAARDERILQKLHKEVKTQIKPLVKIHEKEIMQLKAKLERLEALYGVYSKMGGMDSVKLKELGERIFLTKQTLGKLSEQK